MPKCIHYTQTCLNFLENHGYEFNVQLEKLLMNNSLNEKRNLSAICNIMIHNVVPYHFQYEVIIKLFDFSPASRDLYKMWSYNQLVFQLLS